MHQPASFWNPTATTTIRAAIPRRTTSRAHAQSPVPIPFPILALALAALLHTGPVSCASFSFSYNTTWLGNSYGGGPNPAVAPAPALPPAATDRWVSHGAADLAVGADGLLVTAAPWDEGGRESGIYNGSAASVAGPSPLLLGANYDLHGWGRHGGQAVATAAYPTTTTTAYTYVAMRQEYVPSPPLKPAEKPHYPSSPNSTWFAVRRYERQSGAPAPFPGGRGVDGSMLVLPTQAAPRGLALDAEAGLLFVADTNNSRVLVVNTTSMTILPGSRASIATPFAPGKLAVDGQRLYIASAIDYASGYWPCASLTADGTAQLLVTDYRGAPQPLTLGGPSIGAFGALSINRKRNTLLVGDNGPAQQVHLFQLPSPAAAASDASTALPLLESIGVPGGIFNITTPGSVMGMGVMGSLRLYGLQGVGMSDAGCVFVALNGLLTGTNFANAGLELRKLCPSSSSSSSSSGSSAWKMVWQLQGLEWVDSGNVDPYEFYAEDREGIRPAPSNDRNLIVYTQWHRYEMNLSQPRGQQATLLGYTMDPARFGSIDLRANAQHSLSSSSIFDKHLNGVRLLWITGMQASMLAGYRFEDGGSEIAVPCVLWGRDHKAGDWPPLAPEGQAWYWRDANGDGQFQKSEFAALGPAADGRWGMYLDDHGDVWFVSQDNSTLHFAFTNFDHHYCPTHNLTAALNYTAAAVAPFTRMERIIYDVWHDVMWITGYTAGRPRPGHEWKMCGTVAARYDGWSQKDIEEQEPALLLDLPRADLARVGNSSTTNSAIAVDLAGELFFAVTSELAQVHVFNATSGAQLGVMEPGSAVGNFSGWVDTPYGLSAFQKPPPLDNEYIVLVEEDGREKLLMYMLRVEK